MPVAAPLRTLIVDDSETFLAGLQHWIDTVTKIAVVGIARSGPEALAAAERLNPDLVLLDVVLPGLDGFRVAKTLKARAHPPLVVMATFLASETARKEAFAAGADGFLSKDDLAEGLDLVLDAITSEGFGRSEEVSSPARSVRPGSRTAPDP